MDKFEFSLGDKVYHKSDSSIVWVIENIEGNEADCSTLNSTTKRLLKERFPLITLVKINDSGNGGIIFGNSKNSNYW